MALVVGGLVGGLLEASGLVGSAVGSEAGRRGLRWPAGRNCGPRAEQLVHGGGDALTGPAAG